MSPRCLESILHAKVGAGDQSCKATKSMSVRRGEQARHAIKLGSGFVEVSTAAQNLRHVIDPD